MMNEKYTLKMFMEDHEGFDFENGTIVLFDADLCRQYLLSNETYRTMYLTEERLSKPVYDWKHDDKVMTIILKERKKIFKTTPPTRRGCAGRKKEDMKIIAEWIPYMAAYRLYNPKHPEQTIAYEEDEDTVRRHAAENGYEVTFKR